MFDPVDFELYRTWWKRARPTTSGFQRCYQVKTPIGDFIQVEFNFHDSLVKIQLEPASEKGSTYYSTIKKGTILREKDSSGGNSFRNSVKKAVKPFSVLFSAIPDSELVDSLVGVYEISKIQPIRKQADSKSDQLLVDTNYNPKPKVPFWKKVKNLFIGPEKSIFRYSFKERAFDDFHDTVLGISIASVLYFHFFDFMILGVGLGVLGILFGGMDWTLRNRSPLFTKVLIFLSAGSYFFYTGYTRF